MVRVVHFEFPSSDISSSRKFYENVLGWTLYKWEGPDEYWLIKTGEKSDPGIDGAIYQEGNGLTGTVNTVDVSDLDATLAKALLNGGEVIMPKTEIPGVGLLAYIREPGGAVFGMMQSFPDAQM